MVFNSSFLTTFQLQMRKISTGCILFRCGCQMDRSCQNQIFFMLKIQRDRKRLFLRLGARASDIFSQSLLTTYNCSYSFYIIFDTKKIKAFLTELLHGTNFHFFSLLFIMYISINSQFIFTFLIPLKKNLVKSMWDFPQL